MYFRRRAHTTRDGDHQPSLTPGNVIGKGFEHPQGTHLGPGFVIDIAGLLSRHTGDPRAVDGHVYGDVLAVLTLSASVTSIATTLSLPLLSCAKRLSSLAVAGLRQAVNTRHPPVTY
jgi:hypothetical protein